MKSASRLWHATLAGVISLSLIIQIGLLLTGGQDINAGTSSAHLDLSTRFIRFLSYFTIQSNLVVLCAALSLARDPHRDGRGWRVVRLDALLGISITGLVFVFVLSGLVQHHGLGVLANAGFHYISPVMTVLGWFLFGPRPRIDARTVALAFVWPVLWLAMTLAVGAVNGWYPYPFLDVGQIGYPKALLHIAGVLLVALLLALGLAWLDRRWPKAPSGSA